jgi:cytoskeletal protein RodZ
MIKRIGQQLREARESKPLTLDQVSREIRIRTRYLKALEEGNLGELPSAVHVRGFLRSYADFLGLNADELLNALRQPEGSDLPETQDQKTEDESPSKDSIQQVEAIFYEIGSTIQSRREILGLSLEDIEQYTHIPVHYGQMIEKGEFTKFPSPVQARGMLSNYANFLEMDTQAVLLRYAEALQTRLYAIQADEKTRKPPPQTDALPAPRLPQWLRNILSPDVAIFGTIGVFIVVFTIWGIGRILNTQASLSPQPTAPSLADALLPSPTPVPTTTATRAVTPTPELLPDVGDAPEEGETTAIPTLLPISQGRIQIYIIVRQRTYMKVTTDGEVAFDGRVIPGTNLPYTGNEQIELLTGNAAALQVFYNDNDIGPLGIFGEVIDVVFTRDGLVRPTATPTPTLSLEQLATPTPTYTPTVIAVAPLPEEENTPPP